MSGVHLEPFEEMFLRSARAGYHDGTKTVVGIDYSANVFVQQHEWVHGQVFASLPDGQLLGALLRLYDVDIEPLGLSHERLDELARDLSGTSRTAHEAAATYLSVKMSAPAEQPALLASLDSEYQKYFALLADALDARIGSSYLQYLIAWNTIVVAFSSHYLERFAIDPTAAGLRTVTAEQPNARLAAILDRLGGSFERLLALVDEQFRHACEARAVEYWDPHDERGWTALKERAPQLVTSIEADVTRVLRPFLVAIGGVPVLLDADHREAYEALSRWLQRAGADFTRMSSYDWRAHDAQVFDELDAHNQAGAGIRNAGARPFAMRSALDDWNLVDPASSFLFVEDDQSAGGPWDERETFIERMRAGDAEWMQSRSAARAWNGFAWRGRPYQDKPSETRGLTQEQLQRWLHARSQRPLEETSLMVLVTRPSDELHFMTLHTLLYEEIGVDRGAQQPGKTVLPLCHYLAGNWFTWFENLAWLRGPFQPYGPWKIIVGNIKVSEPVAGSLVLHVLWHGVLGASFFRLTTPHASNRMEPEIERLLELSEVEAMEVDEARVLRPLYEKVVVPGLLKCWSTI